MKRWVKALIFSLVFCLFPFNSFAALKLIALTFDDGPKLKILYGFNVGDKKPLRVPGLLDVLDAHDVKGTFFVMAWRIEGCYYGSINEEYRKALKDIDSRGHEIENHTCGHGPFSKMVQRHGETWVLNDIDRASEIIQSVIGRRPYFVRPPEWNIWPALLKKIEARGYRVMARISDGVDIPPLLADVDSEDYRHYELGSLKRPQCLLYDCIMQKIRQREQGGLYGHIIVFHELPIIVDALQILIPKLKDRGYSFVTLGSYVNILENNRPRLMK